MKTKIEDVVEKATGELAPANSEEAFALEFTKRHGGLLRYVAVWGKWLRWDGMRWDFDKTRKTFSMARDLCREFSVKANKPKEGAKLANAKTRAAVVSLVSDDQTIAAIVDQWDADLWSLNTPSGIVDLRTGKVREHRAEDYMTKITAVAPDKKCPTPLWTKFLSEITNKNDELIKFIQRMFGYSLTGLTKEHALFFLYGDGRNGKGVLMNTVAGIVNDYHRVAPMEMFIETKHERHLTEVARLMGARMVLASETQKNHFWNESRVKQFTGGDRLAANFMRQDHFEYIPQFKLIFAGNHKPRLKSVDVAIASRLYLLPFLVTFSEKQQDKDLFEKLKAEWPGILAWMIAGCVAWQKIGLAPPKVVRDATKEYLKSEDQYRVWFEAACVLDPAQGLESAELYKSWKQYAEANGISYIGSSQNLSEQLAKISGLRSGKVRGQRGLLGVRWRRDDEPLTSDDEPATDAPATEKPRSTEEPF